MFRVDVQGPLEAAFRAGPIPFAQKQHLSERHLRVSALRHPGRALEARQFSRRQTLRDAERQAWRPARPAQARDRRVPPQLPIFIAREVQGNPPTSSRAHRRQQKFAVMRQGAALSASTLGCVALVCLKGDGAPEHRRQPGCWRRDPARLDPPSNNAVDFGASVKYALEGGDPGRTCFIIIVDERDDGCASNRDSGVARV
jgi:hypothetical protein